MKRLAIVTPCGEVLTAADAMLASFLPHPNRGRAPTLVVHARPADTAVSRGDATEIIKQFAVPHIYGSHGRATEQLRA